ncbi:MAG: C25 family cysteine peptidase [Pirellulaceae bacterium]
MVRPAAWAAALESWKQYRMGQGYEIAEVDAALGRDQIRAAIGELAAQSDGKLRFVLLAGDVSGFSSDVDLPTFHYPSSAMVQFGGDPVIASDNAYADLDGDHIPELAIGRIPADSAEQLAECLGRSIAQEQQEDFSQWRRRVHVVAGVGGFGPVADSVIDLTTRRFLSDRVPGWSEMTMTQASLQSPYCPDPFRFSETCVARMNQGGMFWVYIGHGHVKTLDYLQAGDAILPIMNVEHVPQVDTVAHAPIAVFLACYTGAFDAREDSLAERLVLSKTGPIAAIAASRVSGPYGLAMLSDGLLESCFDRRTQTLGEVVLAAKRNLFDTEKFKRTESGVNQIAMINAIAHAMSPPDYDLSAERLEHVWQMNLLGDPLLRLSYPGEIEFESPTRVAPGQELTVRGVATVSGSLTLELALCRGQVHPGVSDQPVGFSTPAEREQYQQRYISANHSLIAQHSSQVAAGPFVVSVTVPDELSRGKYCIRLYQQGKNDWHVGYREIRIRP